MKKKEVVLEMRRIKKVRAIPGTLIVSVKWQDGGVNLIDMSPVVMRSAPLRHLQDHRLFAKIKKIAYGCGVGWPGGLGYGADTLNALAQRQYKKSMKYMKRFYNSATAGAPTA